jgi:hypothetical protein
MDDDGTAVPIEEISDREAICIESFIRRTLRIYEQHGKVTAVISMRMYTEIEVTGSRGERRDTLADCMHVEPVEAWREIMDAYLDVHITVPLLTERRSAHLVAVQVIKLRFRAKIVRPCRSNQHCHRHD